MTTKLIPGQIRNIDGKRVRCKKREFGCEGCILNHMLLCPRMIRNNPTAPNCIEDGVIFIPPK